MKRILLSVIAITLAVSAQAQNLPWCMPLETLSTNQSEANLPLEYKIVTVLTAFAVQHGEMSGNGAFQTAVRDDYPALCLLILCGDGKILTASRVDALNIVNVLKNDVLIKNLGGNISMAKLFYAIDPHIYELMHYYERQAWLEMLQSSQTDFDRSTVPGIRENQLPDCLSRETAWNLNEMLEYPWWRLD